MASDNPYASPQTVQERPSTESEASHWRNRPASIGFLVSLVFPVVALGAVAALFMEDDFGIVRWRVHRLIRLVLFRASLASMLAVAISLLGLAAAPRRLACYGLILGLLGSSYWVLAMLGVLRR
jgi:hypothetical protein